MQVLLQRFIDTCCPPVVSKLRARIQASPIAYRLARGAFWSLVGTLISRGMGLLAGILVARLLGKEDYGRLGMVQSTLGMFGIFAGFGMGLTANKHIAEFRKSAPDRAGRIIGVSSLVAWGTGALMVVVLYFSAPWLARHSLASPEMSGLLQAGGLLLLLGGVNGAQTGALAGFEAFKTIARVNLIAGLVAVPVTLAGAWYGGVLGCVWALGVNLAVNCALNFAALRREASAAGVRLTYRDCFQEWRILWSFSLPAVLGSALAGPITWAVNALLVNQPDGYSQMGIYNAVLRIKIVPEMVVGMLLAPLLPVLSERYALRDVQGYQKTAYSAFTLALLVTAPFALLQIAVPQLVLLPYGHAYAGHNAVVQWLMAELAIVGFFAPMNQLVTSMSRMWFGFGFNLVWASIYGILSWVLVPRYGAAGLAASPILAHLICLGPALYYIHRKEPGLLVGVPLGPTAIALCGVAGLTAACEQVFSPFTALIIAMGLIGALFAMRRAFTPRKTTTHGVFPLPYDRADV